MSEANNISDRLYIKSIVFSSMFPDIYRSERMKFERLSHETGGGSLAWNGLIQHLVDRRGYALCTIRSGDLSQGIDPSSIGRPITSISAFVVLPSVNQLVGIAKVYQICLRIRYHAKE